MTNTGEAGQRFLNDRVVVLKGDITRQRVDAIVNAANDTLLGGGGIDGAIHEAGGPSILAACEELRRTQYPNGLPTGKAVITPAGALPCRYVIHTVGPIKGVHGDQDAELLASCYLNSMTLATQHRVTSLAFPAISTGIYGYPKEEAALVSSQAISNFLASTSTLSEVRLVFCTSSDLQIFLKHAQFQMQ